MFVLRGILISIGVLVVLMGMLWIGQGTGLIMWPASSFMLADRQWALYGALLAAVGVLLVWIAIRRR